MATLDIIVKPKLKFSLKKCGDVVQYGITPEEREKLAGIEENANNYTHPETHPSSILDVVDVVNGDVNKFMNERGEMVAASSIGVTGSSLYASTADSDVAGYKSLAETPQALETETTLTAKSSAGIVWGSKYLSAPFTEAVIIPATAYGFDYWRKVSASNGTSRKHLRVFIYREGEETNISTPLASPDIDETEFTERQISYIFPELSLLAGDRIGIQEGFSTSHANNITLTYIVGDGRGWFMRLPLPLKHESLTNKNGEATFQHIDTTVTKNTLDEADKVPIYDSETGAVVLTPKNNFQSASSNLLYQYIHSGNKEVYISAIDYVTHTFTSVGHGLANGDQLNIKIIGEGIIEQIIPFSANPIATNQIAYYVINSNLDTFKISLTSGGEAVPTINKATQNFSLWRFERTYSANIDIHLPAIGGDIEVLGDIGQIQRQIWINDSYLSAKGYVQNITNYQTATQVVAGRFMYLRGRCNIEVRRCGNITYINRKMLGINLEPTDSTKIKWVSSEALIINTVPIETLTSIQLAEVRLTNGTIINVYKI